MEHALEGSESLPRVLITGIGGFLGVRLLSLYAHRCLPGGARAQDAALPLPAELAGAPLCSAVTGCARGDMDLTDADSVLRTLSAFSPDVVLHCAAVSDTGQAQREPELSYAVNVLGTLHVAQACRRTGAKLICMSSDQVYFGLPAGAPFSEETPLSPANIYGLHKREAEQRGLALVPEAVFLRLTWMYDAPDAPLRQNGTLLKSVLAAAASGTPMQAATHDFRGVTDVWDVAVAMNAARRFPGGIYNFGSGGMFTAFALARAAAQALGVSEALVQPDEARYAPAGRSLLMDTAKARRLGVAFPASGERFTTAAQRIY